MTTVRKAAFSGIVAALYVSLVYVNTGAAFGPVQFRVSEALTLLPFLFPETAAGLFVGCVISHLVSHLGLLDVVFGSLATLLAAVLTAKCKNRWLAAVPPVAVNALTVGLLIALLDPSAASAYGSLAIPFCIGSVALSQAVVCFGLGVPLTYVLQKSKRGRAIWTSTKP